ncbi:MAG: hypothetical protein WCI73_00560 [Phycisphaerae bacterium]
MAKKKNKTRTASNWETTLRGKFDEYLEAYQDLALEDFEVMIAEMDATQMEALLTKCKLPKGCRQPILRDFKIYLEN